METLNLHKDGWGVLASLWVPVELLEFALLLLQPVKPRRQQCLLEG